MISLPLLMNEQSKRLSNNKSNLEDYVIKCYNIPPNINETIFEYLCELLNDKSYKIKKIIKPINQETCSYPWKIICNDKLASFLLKRKKIIIYDDSEKNNKIYVKITPDEEHKDANTVSDSDLNSSYSEKTENINGEKDENIKDSPKLTSTDDIRENITHNEQNDNIKIKRNKKVILFDGDVEENIKGPMKRCENSDIWYCKYNSKCEESDNSECFTDWSSDIESDDIMDDKNKNRNFSENNSENSELKKNNEKILNRDRNRIKCPHGNSSDNESVKNFVYNRNDEKNKENIEKYIDECLKKGEKKKKNIYKRKNMSKEIIKDIPIETLTSEECEFLEKINMKYSKKFGRIVDNGDGDDNYDDKKKSKKFFIYFYEGNSDEIIQDIREEDINKNIIL
ncbi:conserved Plasmodium protein, unknown function [Plasmodium berghei]|uniref:Uncharacterized protein n=1 Tax=Plasmodium berghei TaxID=5821 RepID=A0A0Y9VKC5_PLABE|nr:conserved Plasmodium protein, unknown function [Plasmodium berghei]